MTREERAREAILDAAGVNSGWIELPMEQMLNLLVSFADAEAAAMRERAEADIIAKADRWLAQQYGLRPLAADLAAIRNLPATGEVER